jgi:hypothetical protein
MDQIIFGFSRPKSGFQPFSWAIQFFTASNISHAYVKFYSAKYDRWLIYQASGLAVNFTNTEIFEAKETVVEEFEIPISDEAKQKTIQFAIDNCGAPYGILQIFGILLVILAKKIGIKIPNILYNSSTFVCSELAADILKEIGNGSELDPKVTTPVDLKNYLINNGFNPVK